MNGFSQGHVLPRPGRRPLELSASNHASEAEHLACIGSEAFRRNPSGVPFDPRHWRAQLEAGLSQAELVRID